MHEFTSFKALCLAFFASFHRICIGLLVCTFASLMMRIMYVVFGVLSNAI
jgi:hypothetical protein